MSVVERKAYSNRRAQFLRPAAEFRPAPLFVLNDEFPPGRGEAMLTESLEQMRRAGFGGVYFHPRPGLITEYLSPRWFELIRHGIRECVRLGLVSHLYDENSYPSGFAGGHVAGISPEARSRYVQPVRGTGPLELPEAFAALHRWGKGGPGQALERREVTTGRKWVAFVERDMPALSWQGQTIMPSLLDPRAAGAFIALTHERYHRELGPLWRQVGSIFTDEPHLGGSWHGPLTPGLHLTPYVFGQFRLRRGYELREFLAELFYDRPESGRVRHDFYDLIHELWMENWVGPVSAWCRRRGIALTGHFMEHDWPAPYSSPGYMHALSRFERPGTDLLESFPLKGHDFFDVQNLAPAGPGREPLALMFLRQCLSVANQYGRARITNECWGAGGHDSTPADWLRIGRWLAAHGVSAFVPHQALLTLRGTRKTDHPQSFTPHSAWFEYLEPVNAELSRLAWVAAQGRMEQRVLVLDPQTTAYVCARKADCLEAYGPGSPVPVPGQMDDRLERAQASLLPLQTQFSEFVQALSEAQVDFDLGDEYILAERGKPERGKLRVEAQKYELLVWPPRLDNLRSATVPLLERFLAQGGAIAGCFPSRLTVDGKPSRLLARWRRRFGRQLHARSDAGGLVRWVARRVAPRVVFTGPQADCLVHLRRVAEDGTEYYIVNNPSAAAFQGTVRLRSGCRSFERWDPRTGGAEALNLRPVEGGFEGEVSLAPCAAQVWLGVEVATSPLGSTLGLASPKAARAPLPPPESLRLIAVDRSEPNLCALDFCRLTLDGNTFPEEAVYAANQRYWKARGFETNGWMAMIQHRDQTLARGAQFGTGSGVTATYEIMVDRGAPLFDIQLAVELPHLWRVRVNGHAVAFGRRAHWLDRHVRLAPIGPWLRTGRNLIALETAKFDVRQEIDRLCLLGNFHCRPTRKGFALAVPEPLMLGSWRKQGLPFFDREMNYRFLLPPGARAGRLTLNPFAWAGSLLVVEHASREIGRWYEPPLELDLIASSPEVTVRVVGLPKNVYGPWHDPARPRGRAWVTMWHGPAIPTAPPPGASYDLLDLGLFAPPIWEERR